MNLKVFSLLDSKTGHFSPPFFTHHVGNAIRMCIDVASDMSTQIARHPADFILCQLGTWDDQSGQFETSVPMQIGAVVGFLPHQPSLGLAGQSSVVRTGEQEIPFNGSAKEL